MMKHLYIELFNGGCFFRDLIELLNAITSTSCWMRFTPLALSVTTLGQDDTNTHWCADMKINAVSTFTMYKLTVDQLDINIDPKKISKLCRNIKRTDKISISYTDEGRFSLVIHEERKLETKTLPYNMVSVNDSSRSGDVEVPRDMFNESGFDLRIVEILNLKKAIGNKREIVDVQLCENQLTFSTMGQFIAPISIMFGDQVSTGTPTIISFSGKILNIIGKLNNISKVVTFKKSAVNARWLLVTTPLASGVFSFYIMNKENDPNQNAL